MAASDPDLIVSISAARTKLSSLVELAAAGRTIIITKNGKPIAKLISAVDETPRNHA